MMLVKFNVTWARKLTLGNIAQRIDDDSLALFHCDDLGRAVRHTTVVDESGNTAFLCRIDDSILVYSEEVTASDA